MRHLKLYLETSVWNFYYADDAPEKKAVTHSFFENLRETPLTVYASELVLDEFSQATEEKQQKLTDLFTRHDPAMLAVGSEVKELAQAYLDHQVLPQRAHHDALHIACASVYELDLVISWNLRHIANIRRQESVQAINLLNGYTKPVQLITPMEVSGHEWTED